MSAAVLYVNIIVGIRPKRFTHCTLQSNKHYRRLQKTLVMIQDVPQNVPQNKDRFQSQEDKCGEGGKRV